MTERETCGWPVAGDASRPCIIKKKGHKGSHRDARYRERKQEWERQRLAARSAAIREMLSLYKLASGCASCGYKEDARALHFDHLDPGKKSFSVSRPSSHSLEVVLAEVAKCQILCANCHAVKTYEEKDHLRRNNLSDGVVALVSTT